MSDTDILMWLLTGAMLTLMIEFVMLKFVSAIWKLEDMELEEESDY